MSSNDNSHTREKFSILPLTLSLKTVGDIATPVALRGTPLPTKRSQVFTTPDDDQTTVTLELYFGERPIASANKLVGTYKVTDIPAGPKGDAQIRVTIYINEYCEVTVETTNDKTSSRLHLEANIEDIRLTSELVQSLHEEAESHKEMDQVSLKRAEQFVRKQELIHKAEAKLTASNPPHNRDELEKTIAEVGIAAEQKDKDELNKKLTKLENQLAFSEFPSALLSGSFFGQPPNVTQSNSDTRKSQSKAKHKTKSKKNENTNLSTGPQHKNIGKIFGSRIMTLDPNYCFVLMPFVQEMKPIYEDHIRPVVKKCGMTCSRADEITGTNLITVDIWEHINRARFIIADLTGQNANVFYEVGLAHAVGKDVILLTQTMGDVPFDLRPLRCVEYTYDPRGVKTLEKQLKDTIETLIGEG